MNNKPFALVGVNSDKKDRVLAAIRDNGISWRSFWDGGSTGGPIATAWGVRGWPTIYVIDDRGEIRYKNVRGDALDRAVDELVERATVTLVENLKSTDPDVRGWAAFGMGKYDAPDARESISPLLEDPEATVRQRTAVGLALLGEAVEPLLPLIRKAAADPNLEIRVAGLQTLGQAADQESLPQVRAALEDEQVAVRRVAVVAIANLEGPEIVPTLANAVDDADTQTARAAALSLADRDSPDATAALRELAGNTEHPVRVWIAVAMHRAAEGGTAERFKRLLGDPNPGIRREAAAALSELSNFDATDLHLAALEDDTADVRQIARSALQEHDEPRVVEALQNSLVREIDTLIPLLSARNYNDRNKAASQLKTLGPAVAPLLLERLEASEPQGRYQLATAIGQLQNPAVIPPVAARLMSPDLDTSLRSSYETILRSLRNEGRAAVDELVAHEEPAARESGVRLLSSYRDSRAVDALTEALQDTAPRVRVHAALGLSSRQDDGAFEVLRRAATDSDRDLQQLAVSGLTRYDGPTALPVLTALMDEADNRLQSTLLYALGNFKEEEATAAITAVCGQNPAVRGQAILSLRRQDTPAAARALGELLLSDDTSLQRSARAALGRMRTPEAKAILQRAEQEAALEAAETPE